MADLTIEALKKMLRYDPETGHFTWLVSFRGNHRKVGERAGFIDPIGYRRISLCGKKYRAGRLAWLYVTGAWPPDQIDHVNCVKDDDRFANLRPATIDQNARNKGRRRNAAAPLKGAHKNQAGSWSAMITHVGRTLYLGRFDTAERAHAAYLEAAQKLHGEFARAA